MTPDIKETHQIDLVLQDGEHLIFYATENKPVLQAAAEAGWLLPALCQEGGCGSCRAACTEGIYYLNTHSVSALSKEAAQHREVLLCRLHAQSDLILQAPFDKKAVQTEQPVIREAQITEKQDLGGQTIRLLLTLQPDADGDQSANFEAGQFVQLNLPGTSVWRAYSLSNIANWSGEFELLIRLQPNGLFSTWLAEKATVGQTLSLRLPQGGFTLKDNGLRPRWFVGGGTGLAPLLSMLRHMAEWQDPQPTRLYFGVNTEADLFDLRCLDDLKEQLPALKIYICIWQPSASWKGLTGTPVDFLLSDLKACSSFPDLYLCGPSGLIEAAHAAARTVGLPETQIMSERFLPSGTV